MLRYALRRIFGVIPTLLIIIALSFFVIRLAPGGPFDEEQTLPPEVKANLEAAYGLDKPLPSNLLAISAGSRRVTLVHRISSKISRSPN